MVNPGDGSVDDGKEPWGAEDPDEESAVGDCTGRDEGVANGMADEDDLGMGLELIGYGVDNDTTEDGSSERLTEKLIERLGEGDTDSGTDTGMLESETGIGEELICDKGTVEGRIDGNGVDDSPKGVEMGITLGIDRMGDDDDTTALDEMKWAGVLDGVIDEGTAEEVEVTVAVELMVLVEHTFSGPINLALSNSRIPPSCCENIKMTIVCEVEVASHVPEMVFQPAPGEYLRAALARRWPSSSMNKS